MQPYIPLRDVTALAGDGGVGKTTVLKAVASSITAGRVPYTAATRPAADVLLHFGEDDLATSVKADMERMGADTQRVHCITGIYVEDEEESWRLDQAGIDALLEEARAIRPALIGLDTVLEITPEFVDLHKAREVREMLRPMRDVARALDCAVIFTIHLSKAGNGRAQSRVQGSVDFVNFARSVLMVGPHPEDERQRLLTHAKTNLGPRGETLAWSYDPEHGLMWRGPVDVSADQAFAPPPAPEARMQQAQRWLLAHHTGGTRPKAEVVADAIAAGIAERPLEDAYRALGGRAQAIHVDGHRGAHHWDWPPISPQNLLPPSGMGVNHGSKSELGRSPGNSSAGAKNGHQPRGHDLLTGFTPEDDAGGKSVVCPHCHRADGVALLGADTYACDDCGQTFRLMQEGAV
jgi:hypothetical protein